MGFFARLGSVLFATMCGIAAVIAFVAIGGWLDGKPHSLDMLLTAGFAFGVGWTLRFLLSGGRRRRKIRTIEVFDGKAVSCTRR